MKHQHKSNVYIQKESTCFILPPPLVRSRVYIYLSFPSMANKHNRGYDEYKRGGSGTAYFNARWRLHGTSWHNRWGTKVPRDQDQLRPFPPRTTTRFVVIWCHFFTPLCLSK